MVGKQLIISIFVLFVLMGCQSEGMKEISVIPWESNYIAVEVLNQVNNKKITIREQVKGNDVYVECVVADFSFSSRKKKNDGDGYLNLYLNNKKIDEIYSAAFVIKGIPNGKHQFKIELVNNNGEKIGVEDTFEVEIQNENH